MKLEDILEEGKKPKKDEVKVRRHDFGPELRTRVRDKDVRRQSRTKQKREWKKLVKDYS